MFFIVMFQMRQEEVEAHVDDIFSRLDTNRDGVVTIEEFVEACQRVSSTQRNMLEEMHPSFFLGLHHFYIVAEFRLEPVISKRTSIIEQNQEFSSATPNLILAAH